METPQEFAEKWSQNGLGWWDRLFMWLSLIFVFVGTGLVVFEFWNQPGKGVVPILLAGIAWILVRLVAIAEGLLVDVEDLQVIIREREDQG